MAKETAEQKLLKLIEKTDAEENTTQGQTARESPEAQKVYNSVRGVGAPALAIPSFVQNILLTFKAIWSPNKSSSSFGLREVNRILALGIVITAVIFGINFSKGMGSLEAGSAIEHKGVSKSLQQTVEDLNSLLPQLRDLKQYADVVTRRNIFQPFERSLVKTDEDVLKEELGIKRVSEQTKDLKLVGISWFDSPDTASAMVENTISGVTYFLRQGERVNEVMIKSIYAESIVVSYQGEDIEMKL